MASWVFGLFTLLQGREASGPYYLDLDGLQVKAAPALKKLGGVQSRSGLKKEFSLFYFKKGMVGSVV